MADNQIGSGSESGLLKREIATIEASQGVAALAERVATLQQTERANLTGRLAFWRDKLSIDNNLMNHYIRLGAIANVQNEYAFARPDDSSGLNDAYEQLVGSRESNYEQWLQDADKRFQSKPKGGFAPAASYLTDPSYHVMVGACWLSELIDELVSYFGYDLGSLETAIHQWDDQELDKDMLFTNIQHGGTGAMSALVKLLAKTRIPLFTPSLPVRRQASSVYASSGVKWFRECGQTVFYRVTRPNEQEADVLRGLGAFFATGGRYNRIHQATVYAAADPVVAITEAAYYQARKWQEQIGGQPNLPKPNGPLVSRHRLWCIKVTGPLSGTASGPSVVGIPSNEASIKFSGMHDYELFNPSHDYENLRVLADQIRAACIANPHMARNPAAIGIAYPSVRTPNTRGYAPQSYAFFKTALQGSSIQGDVVDMWEMQLEFLDMSRQRITSTNTSRVDWTAAEFVLDASSLSNPQRPVPSFRDNPAAADGFQQRQAYRIEINYV
jgi:RES domain